MVWDDTSGAVLRPTGHLAFVLAKGVRPDECHLPAHLPGLVLPGSTARVWLQPPGASGPSAINVNPCEEGYADKTLRRGTLPDGS